MKPVEPATLIQLCEQGQITQMPFSQIDFSAWNVTDLAGQPVEVGRLFDKLALVICLRHLA